MVIANHDFYYQEYADLRLRWKQPASLSSSQRVSERCRSRISTPVTEWATEPQCAFVVAGQRAEPGQQSRRDDRSVQFAHERDPRGDDVPLALGSQRRDGLHRRSPGRRLESLC